ncbi:MAG: transcriptional repressor LexA [candidate division WOR-3 bacterium]|nr:transcriptional repressor LexA [candidate division WOR-3 bacterium]MDH5683934.1 transcriptional repressor LexA [candidate division WOR-3 bacterium]
MFTKEARVLSFIKSWLKDKNYPPSVREIGKGVGLKSTKAVKYHLDKLVLKGQLTRKSYQARTLELKEKSQGLPLVGRIAAGEPILAIENIEDHISLDAQFDGCFLLKVTGDSMKQAGIFNNDFVIVKPQKTVNNDDIVVALIEDEATVKRFYRENNQILLKPENPDYSPIIVDESKNFAIIGIVVGVLRLHR